MTAQEFKIDDKFIATVTQYVREYMANYDGSHDFHHIERVVHLAQHIQSKTPNTSRDIVTLCGLLHDVGDRKYLKPGQDASRLISDYLFSQGMPQALADKIQTICMGVSYSSEIKDPAKVLALIEKHPELAVVQDADRLDAIGAVGIGRVFAFGGARNRSLQASMDHFDEKLLKLEDMMKTETGRQLARERTDRMQKLKDWYLEETEGVPALA